MYTLYCKSEKSQKVFEFEVTLPIYTHTMQLATKLIIRSQENLKRFLNIYMYHHVNTMSHKNHCTLS